MSDTPITPAPTPQSLLLRGRLITLTGVLILCFDTPTFRLLKLSSPAGDQLAFGLAAACWRGGCFAVASLFSLRRETRTMQGLRAAAVALGWRSTLAGTLLLSGSGLAFPVACALTTATNVLVILAIMPFAVALMTRALGVRQPLHAWVAAICGVASVALVFVAGLNAGPAQARGCVLALVSMACFSAFLTLSSYKGAVSCVLCMPFSGVLISLVSLAVLNTNYHYAMPASASDTVLLLLNGNINGVANILLVIGAQAVPATEVSLISLLETALSPVFVFLVTLRYAAGAEVPDQKSIIAAVLILVTLIGHTAYDVHLERQRRQRVALLEAQELTEAPAEA